jgi:hypothetical protein
MSRMYVCLFRLGKTKTMTRHAQDFLSMSICCLGLLFASACQSASMQDVDIVGLKLGMSVDEVRTALKSQNLGKYKEWTQNLAYQDETMAATGSTMRPVSNGSYINVIAAWRPSPPLVDYIGEGESFLVVFTPVPGNERAAWIRHAVGYTIAKAIRLVDLENGVAKKYGEFRRASQTVIQANPTWLLGPQGLTYTDNSFNACNVPAFQTYRDLGTLEYDEFDNQHFANFILALRPDFFKSNAHCGSVILKEASYVQNYQAPVDARIVTRYTVTAFSPTVALEGGVAASKLSRAAEDAANKAHADQAKQQAAPKL